MKRIVIELAEDFHKEVKLRAVMTDRSVKGYITDLLKKDLNKEKEQTH